MERLPQNKLTLVGIILIILSGCGKDPEPVMTGEYYIDNQTLLTLKVETDQPLINESVPANTIVHVLTNQVGSGGSADPPHTFSRFRVTAFINNRDSLLYEFDHSHPLQDWEVRNAPFIQGASTNSITKYYLTILR